MVQQLDSGCDIACGRPSHTCRGTLGLTNRFCFVSGDDDAMSFFASFSHLSSSQRFHFQQKLPESQL